MDERVRAGRGVDGSMAGRGWEGVGCGRGWACVWVVWVGRRAEWVRRVELVGLIGLAGLYGLGWSGVAESWWVVLGVGVCVSVCAFG